jgi:large subunit ribosomal protein L19
MNTEILRKIEQKPTKRMPDFKAGDTIDVGVTIREGDKQRIQHFKGVVVAIKGSGARQMFTVRKISYGIGVEKIFPIASPNISDIVLVKKGRTRRSKLYYLRSRVGKLALKVKPGEAVVPGAEEMVPPEEVAVEAPAEEAA